MYCMFRAKGSDQLCCYDNYMLVPFNSGGGHMRRFSSITHPAQHLMLDRLPYLMCSKFSNNSQKFNELRPTDNCIGNKIHARGESVHKDTVVFLLLSWSIEVKLTMYSTVMCFSSSLNAFSLSPVSNSFYFYCLTRFNKIAT